MWRGKAKIERLKLFTTCISVADFHDERELYFCKAPDVKISFFVDNGEKVEW